MSDEIRKALFALADRIEEANGKPISVDTAAAYALRTALAQKPTPAVPDGWQLVPVERIHTALEAVQNAMLDAYSNAYQECCGRRQDQCCGDPDVAWSAKDQCIIDALSPAQRELSALLAAAPAAPVVREPVAFVSQETFSSDGTSDILTRNLPIGTALYAAPPATQQPDAWTPSGADYDRNIHRNPDAAAWADLFVATFPGLADKHDLMLGWFANAMMAMHDHLKAEQPDTVVVPRELLKRIAIPVMLRWQEDAHADACAELRALLAGGAE